MKAGQACFATIEEFEGWYTKLPDGRYTAYLDKLPKKSLWSPGYRGLWTIGPGLTGPEITKGTTWTREEIVVRFRKMIAEHEAALDAKCKKLGIKLDQNQYDALISASWNLGHESTLIEHVLELLKLGKEEAAANLFLKYDYAGGKKTRGLTRRRKAERELFLKHTVETLYAASRKLTWLMRARAFITSLGIGTYFTWDTLAQVRQYAGDHIGLTLIVIAVLVWLSFKAIEFFIVKDHEEGRYTPSGDIEGETA